jgi:putative aminopeptidase FrvX
MCNEIIWASGLDDRLGIMMAFHALNKYKIKADLLITDNEEWAQSTAQYHSLKQYNWIIGLDRGGIDYVDYGLCAPSFHQIMQYMIKVKNGFGTFSDISFLRTNISCINLGIGYYNAHSESSYCKIDEVNLALKRFLVLYKYYHKIPFKQLNTYKYNNSAMDEWTDSYSNWRWV